MIVKSDMEREGLRGQDGNGAEFSRQVGEAQGVRGRMERPGGWREGEGKTRLRSKGRSEGEKPGKGSQGRVSLLRTGHGVWRETQNRSQFRASYQKSEEPYSVG